MFPFKEITHIVPAQHTREFPSAVDPTSIDHRKGLNLSLKQYIPLDNLDPSPGDVTIIGAHANGFCKELYEPLWCELHASLHHFNNKTRIRAIWIADVAHQGQSSVLNEDSLGDDPSEIDHARDLLFVINLFQKEMPPPLIGVGHSVGAVQLLYLSNLHPRLLTSLFLIEPVLEPQSATKALQPLASASLNRQDTWPTFEAAKENFTKNPVFQKFDKRVFDRWMRFGIRPVHEPNPLCSNDNNAASGAVTLTTPKAQEMFTYMRRSYEDSAYSKPQASANANTIVSPDELSLSLLDANPERRRVYNTDGLRNGDADIMEADYPFYKAEPVRAYYFLPMIRPRVLFVYGGRSAFSGAEAVADKLSRTGTGKGGSGGHANGCVSAVVLPGGGHLVPLEDVAGTGSVCGDFIETEVGRWWEGEMELRGKWERKRMEMGGRVDVDAEWKAMMEGVAAMKKRGKKRMNGGEGEAGGVKREAKI